MTSKTTYHNIKTRLTALLTDHYITITAALIALTAITLWGMGQQLICSCGDVKLWHGALTEQSSQHLTDWFTLHHVLRGIITYGLLRYFAPSLSFGTAFVVAVSLEAAWEIIENSPWVIERYRDTANTDYTGDAVINSMSDIASMIVGYLFAYRSAWWASVLLGVAIEAFTLYMIHDSLLLNVIMLIYPFEAIREWQLAVWT